MQGVRYTCKNSIEQFCFSNREQFASEICSSPREKRKENLSSPAGIKSDFHLTGLFGCRKPTVYIGLK